MKNLKRVLALTLVVAMMFTFAISAGAATTKTYSDQDSITHADAAAVLTELGVLKGYEDGSFKPTANVTRAEMAKMITVILNKGVDNQSMFTDGTTDLTDINWHWAKGYITYCYTLGIIAGDGAPSYKFRPDDPVTGTEAAKMLLVALGADVTQEGLVGTNWDVKANALANSTGLFDDTTDAVNQPASRDFVVQMVYNMLSANTIEYNVNYFTGISTKLTDTELAITKYFGAKKYVGVITANEFADLSGGDALAVGKTTVAVKEVNGLETVSSTSNVSVVKDQTFNVSTDEGYLGRKVNLFYNETTKKVIGNPVIKSTDNIVVEVGPGPPLKDAVKAAGLKLVDGAYDVNLHGVGGGGVVTGPPATVNPSVTADRATVTVGGTTTNVYATEYFLNYAPYNPLVVNGPGTAVEIDTEIKDTEGYTVVAISNDDTNTVNYVFYVAPILTEVSKVTTKGPDKFYKFNGNFTNDDYGSPDGTDAIVTSLTTLAKDDVVLVTFIGGKFYVEAPETFKGKITARVSGDKASLTVGGDKLSMSDIDTYVDADDYVVKGDTEYGNLKFDTEYTYLKDTKGNIAAVLANDGSSSYAFVTGVSEVGGYSDKHQARLLFADGTTASHEIRDANTSSSITSNYGTLTGALAGSAVKTPIAVKYSMNGSKVDLTAVSASATTTTLKKETAKIGTTSYYGDSKTVYYYAVNDNGSMSYYTFTGYTNAPSVNNDTGNTVVWAVSENANTVASAVYVWVDKDDYVGASSKDYVFIYGSYEKYNDYAIYDCVYIMANGDVKYDEKITVDEVYPTNGIYEYSLKSAGVYELSGPQAQVLLTTYSSKVTNIAWAGGYANITTKTQFVMLGGPAQDKVEDFDKSDLVSNYKLVVVKIKDSDDASFVWVVNPASQTEIDADAAAQALATAKTAVKAYENAVANWMTGDLTASALATVKSTADSAISASNTAANTADASASNTVASTAHGLVVTSYGKLTALQSTLAGLKAAADSAVSTATGSADATNVGAAKTALEALTAQQPTANVGSAAVSSTINAAVTTYVNDQKADVKAAMETGFTITPDANQTANAGKFTITVSWIASVDTSDVTIAGGSNVTTTITANAGEITVTAGLTDADASGPVNVSIKSDTLVDYFGASKTITINLVDINTTDASATDPIAIDSVS